MPNESPTRFKQGTAAWLLEKQIQGGQESVREALGKYAGRTEPFFVTKRGEPALRRDIVPPANDSTGVERIEYLDFSPPSTWQPLYSLQHVTFSKESSEYLMTHPGEELIAPTAGKIYYDWIVPRDGNFELERYHISQPVLPGQLLRVNPSVPHCTRGEGRPATAWMGHLDISRNTVAIRSKGDSALKPRVITEVKLRENPEYYSMLATGLSATIRLLRMSPDMDIAKLANFTGMDRAQLSRIESGKANVMMDKLDKIGEALGFDFTEFFLKRIWLCQRYDLAKRIPLPGRGTGSLELLPQSERFFLHHGYLELTKTHHDHQPRVFPQGSMSSWVVLDGDAIINMGDKYDDAGELQERREVGEELLKQGQVIHFRRPLDCKIEARGKTKILQITCSSLYPARWVV